MATTTKTMRSRCSVFVDDQGISCDKRGQGDGFRERVSVQLKCLIVTGDVAVQLGHDARGSVRLFQGYLPLAQVMRVQTDCQTRGRRVKRKRLGWVCNETEASGDAKQLTETVREDGKRSGAKPAKCE